VPQLKSELSYVFNKIVKDGKIPTGEIISSMDNSHEGCVSKEGLRASMSGASVWCLNGGQVSALAAM